MLYCKERRYEFLLMHCIHNLLVSFFELLSEEEDRSKAFLSFSFHFGRLSHVHRKGQKTYIRGAAV